MEELLSLKWNNHKSTFIHVLGILRDKQLYTDATIACEGKFYSVHKLVLSTCSDYFSAMLDRTNCKNPIIVLKDIKCEDLEALLDYMYLGEVNVRQSDLATLIKAAECLRVKGLAVPDDEPPPPRKTKASDNQSRRGDTSGSPPAKRKRRSEVDDGRDDVRPSRQDIRSSSPIHRSKSPSAPMSTPLSPVHSRNTPLRQPTEATVPPSPKTSQHQEDSNTDGTTNNSMHNNQGYQSSDQAEPFVKVEMDDGGGGEVETYDLSNDGAFKEEGGDDGATSGGGGGESGNDLSNDLPEFLQQATSNPLQGGAFGHSSFAGSSSFQPGEMPGWQGDGSNIGFPHLNFGSTEGSSQQNAPGKCEGDPADDAGEGNLNQVEPICLLDENVSARVALDVDASQVDAMTMFCRRLKVDPSQLLSREFLQNTEFMELMTSTASTARHYNDLVSTWQGNQRFMKKVSDVFAKYKMAETALDELTTAFIQIDEKKVSTTKTSKEKVHQDKSALIEILINLLLKAKKLMDQVVPGLQACIRAQKARRLSKIRASMEAMQDQGGLSELGDPSIASLNGQESNVTNTDYISYDMMESLIEGQRSPLKDEDAKSSVNKCRVCQATFHNRYQLIKHQNVEGHKLKRGRPSTSVDDA